MPVTVVRTAEWVTLQARCVLGWCSVRCVVNYVSIRFSMLTVPRMVLVMSVIELSYRLVVTRVVISVAPRLTSMWKVSTPWLSLIVRRLRGLAVLLRSRLRLERGRRVFTVRPRCGL